MRNRPGRSGVRGGLTLLEVVVALAIFVVGAFPLLILINRASNRSVEVDWKSQASLRCQSKMSELLVGLIELESVSDQPFADDENWLWNVQVEEDLDGLFRATVQVRRDMANGDAVRVELTQLMLSPYVRGSSLDPSPSADFSSTAPTPPSSSEPDPAGTPAEPEAAPAAPSGSGGTPGGGTPGGGPSGGGTPAPGKTGGGGKK